VVGHNDLGGRPEQGRANREEGDWNSGPTHLMAGASSMTSDSKVGSRRKPSGRRVQQGRSLSVKNLKLLKSHAACTIIQFGS